MNIADYTAYKTPFPVGVKLPEIKIEKKYYDEVGCSESNGLCESIEPRRN